MSQSLVPVNKQYRGGLDGLLPDQGIILDIDSI